MNAAEVLSKIIEISTSPVETDRKLTNLVEALAQIFAVPFCGVFLLDTRRNRLQLKYANIDYPEFPAGMTLDVASAPFRDCVEKRIPFVAEEHPEPRLEGSPPSPFSSLPFLAAFPIADDIFLYGILVLAGKEPRSLAPDEKFLFPVICLQVAGTIRSGQISFQSRRRIAELSTLYSIGMAITSTLELDELLNRITLTSAKILQADGSILRLQDEERRQLKAVSSFGFEESAGALEPVPFGERVAGTVALTGEPILIADVKKSAFPLERFPQRVVSLICVPLVAKSKTIGTLSLFSYQKEDQAEKTFDEEDKNLLSTLGAQIAMAIEHAIILHRTELLAKEKENMVEELSLLYQVSHSMLTTVKLEQLLRIILISISLKSHRGFDRAALFLVNEKDNMLEGAMGIGPRNETQAETWRQEFEKTHIFSTDWVLSAEMENTPYEILTRRIQISLGEKQSILVRAILEKKAFNIEDAVVNPEVNPSVLKWFGSKAFAVVPLTVKDKAIGVIAVDNRFTERPITSGDLGFLTLLANQAALAIENSRLYTNIQEVNSQLLQAQTRLIQSEKLASLGEVVASISHEIKNPLVSIGGFVRRLDRKFPDDSSEKKYMSIVLKEVKRLERILDETLSFSKDSAPPSDFHGLNRLLEDTLSTLENEFQERNILVVRELALDLPSFFCDPQQIKQVFINLLFNAMQAIGQNGRLTLQSSRHMEGEKEFIQVKVTDTGGGIHADVLDNIFNPFFTTKFEGTGLGLSIAHKIITKHRGTIHVINDPGVGATFLIQFPVG
jgi:two-component system, NtrC family, sensor histidine kinase HydH